MEKKDREFLYKLESYTRDLAIIKLQQPSKDFTIDYKYNFIESTLEECSKPLRWLLRDHLKVVWKIETLKYRLNNLYYGDQANAKDLKNQIRMLEEQLVIKDIRESSKKPIDDLEEVIDIEAVKKGYEYLKSTLVKQEEWIKRNPSRKEFLEEIELTKDRIKNIEEYLKGR